MSNIKKSWGRIIKGQIYGQRSEKFNKLYEQDQSKIQVIQRRETKFNKLLREDQLRMNQLQERESKFYKPLNKDQLRIEKSQLRIDQLDRRQDNHQILKNFLIELDSLYDQQKSLLINAYDLNSEKINKLQSQIKELGHQKNKRQFKHSKNKIRSNSYITKE